MAAATYWCSANNYFPFPRSSVWFLVLNICLHDEETYWNIYLF
jgi:hypothetical protein